MPLLKSQYFIISQIATTLMTCKHLSSEPDHLFSAVPSFAKPDEETDNVPFLILVIQVVSLNYHRKWNLAEIMGQKLQSCFAKKHSSVYIH